MSTTGGCRSVKLLLLPLPLRDDLLPVPDMVAGCSRLRAWSTCLRAHTQKR